MSRPKKDADLVRPHRITFRLTDVEYEIIKKRCEGAGVGKRTRCRSQNPA